jgi:hypothetical protein
MLAALTYITIVIALGFLLNFRESWAISHVSTWKKYWNYILALFLLLCTPFNPVWMFILKRFNINQNTKLSDEKDTEDPEDQRKHMFYKHPRFERAAFSVLTMAIFTYCFWATVWFFTIPHELKHCPVRINGVVGSNYSVTVGLVPGFNQQFPCLVGVENPTYHDAFGDERIHGYFDVYSAKFRSTIPEHRLTVTIHLECFSVLYRCDVEYEPSLQARDEKHELVPVPPQTHQNPMMALVVGVFAFVLLFVLIFFCTACILAILLTLCCCSLII